jgi:hypothetical protein
MNNESKGMWKDATVMQLVIQFVHLHEGPSKLQRNSRQQKQ